MYFQNFHSVANFNDSDGLFLYQFIISLLKQWMTWILGIDFFQGFLDPSYIEPRDIGE